MLTLGALAIALLAGCGQADAPGAATAAPAPVTSTADAATATSTTSTTQATPATPAAPAATSPAPAGSDAATSANPPTANAAGGDPFAGIDPSQHDVLRAIARIDPAAAKGTSRPTPSTAAPSREAAGAGGVTGTDSARPAARPTPAAAPAPTAAAPLANGAASLPVTTTAPANGAAPTPSAANATTASAAAAIATAAPASPPPAAATQIAAASPTSALNSTNAPARAALRAIAQPRPEFPREALREGYTQGRVLAALAIDADGRVTDVTVLSATPSRSFARAAQQALRQWRYEPVGAPTSVQVEMLFRSE